MKAYLEHIAAFPASKDGSWTLFDRKLPAIPFEWHYNTEFELTLTLNSMGQRFIGDSIAPYSDGDLVLIAPKIPHTWCSSSDCGGGPTHEAIVLWFTESFINTLIRPHPELRRIQILLDSSTKAIEFSEEIRAQARPMICAMLSQSAEDRLPAFLQLLLLLSRDSKARALSTISINLPDPSEDRISRVLAYVHKHYREHNAIDQLSRVAALSRSSLHRLFKQQTGTTIKEYIKQLRIGNACALLINTPDPISLVADYVGYKNLVNFNRQFKEMKGLTPREFRTAHKAASVGGFDPSRADGRRTSRSPVPLGFRVPVVDSLATARAR